MTNKLFKYLKIFLPTLIGVYLMYYFYSKLTGDEKDKIVESFKNANYFWVCLSLLVAFLSHYSRAWRWKYMLESMNYKTSQSNRFHTVMITYLFNLVIPRFGEIARPIALAKKEKISFSKTFGTVVSERIVDLVLLLIITFIAGLIAGKKVINSITQTDNPEKDNNYILWIILNMIFLTIVILLVNKKTRKLLLEKFRNVFEGVKTIIKLKKKTYFILHTLFIWFSYLSMFWLCALSLPEVSDIDYRTIIVGFIVGGIAIAATPGGVGLYPTFVNLALIKIGGIEDGIGFCYLMWTTQTAFVILLGLISLFSIKLNISDFFNKNERNS